MNKIIAFAIKVSGGGWLWEKANGFKTILGFVGKMLAGAGSMLAGSSNIILTLVTCESGECAVSIARGISTNADAILAMAGFAVFCSGLQGLGEWHKAQKAKAAESAYVLGGASIIK